LSGHTKMSHSFQNGIGALIQLLTLALVLSLWFYPEKMWGKCCEISHRIFAMLMPCGRPARVEPLTAELLQEGDQGGDDAQRFGAKMGQNFRYWRYPFLAVFLLVSVTISLERIGACDANALKDMQPPFGGQLLPDKVRLLERLNWFQFARYLDVYDAKDGTHIGYFYDMSLLLWMRFGFSDASGQIWFEARYASFLSRFKFWIEYSLQRCDVAPGGRFGYIWDVKENWWARPWPWECIFNCAREFHIWGRPDGSVPQITQSHRLPGLSSTRLCIMEVCKLFAMSGI